MVRNCIKKTGIFIVAVLFMGTAAFGKDVVLGGKKGWPVFQYNKNVTMGQGRFGYDCIEVASNSFVSDEYTDLLIDFENPGNPISSGDYRIVENNLKISDQTINEKAAGLSRNIGGLSISGNPGSFFGSEGLIGSFSMEFWLCPSVSDNGETIVKWDSSKNIDGRLVYQALSATFDKGSIEWNFLNFFDNTVVSNIDDSITLKGTTRIIPDTWSHHVISYDCETGILEYIVDGITEDLVYMTSNGREDGDVALIYLGTPSQLNFCTEYTGKIDDIRLLRRAYSQPDFQNAENAGPVGHVQYLPEGGYFVTKPIMVSKGAVLTSLEAEMNVPSQTAINYYVRTGDNYFGWNDSYPEWKAVESGEELEGLVGLYFQVAAELFPDGDGEITPSITEIKLNYEEIPEPLPPFTVKAQAGNGSVKVSWNYSVDDSVGGYYLYYGNRPGEYLGRVALEGDSPINVGNKSSFTVTGLENGKIYYFAVAAWSAYDENIVGRLSKEVFARPLARLK